MADQPRNHTWVTYVLVAANLAMFGYELAIGVHPTSPTTPQILGAGANFAPLTTNGEWWRLVSAMFLHIGLLHIALNMVCLWQGRVVELLYGRLPFGVLYFVAGLAGGLATIVRSSTVVSAGASGAVFGVYGAFGAFLVFRRSVIDERVWKTTARGIGMFVVINLVFGFTVPGIDVSAHIGGLVAGFLCGAALLFKGARRPTLARTLVVAGGSAAVLVGIALAIPKAFDPDAAIHQFGAVEARVLASFDTLQQEVVGKTVSDADALQRLERDVVTPWRAAHATIRDGGARVNDRLRPLFESIDRYAGARDEAWRTYGQFLEASGDEREALHARFVEQWRASQAEINRAETELKKLSAPR
ncbi:MAG TPA: rhomboid family intramembrane serine protease [Kofleriaceae bacterium]|nr:rhomboid family intramembrane serine protease [Kofleriaceae bacterium]